jgi:hypothetical protein
MSRRKGSLAIVGFLLLALALTASSRTRFESELVAAATSSSQTPLGLAGTASCSGRSCHGGLEPTDGKVRQDEFTFWLSHDKHANAYQILLGPRARRMAENLAALNEPNRVIFVHENSRCLACHTVPQAAGSQLADELVEETRQLGVGCEACHGLANGGAPKDPWLAAHTTAEWKNLTPEQKAERGMVNLADPGVLTKTCAGCHVGSVDRDLNHDLMAAGHPRLTFEATVFRANLPRHWNEMEKARTRGAEFEAKLWAVGQVAAAKSSLELLDHRAEKVQRSQAPWPEFAEYGCFACHANLQQPSWRRDADGYYAGRKPGDLPYGTWSMGLFSALESEGPNTASAAWNRLKKLMEQPDPDPSQVRLHVKEVSDRLDELLKSAAQQRFDQVLAQLALRANKADSFSWDEAEQLVLAVAALQPNPQGEKARLRKELFQKLAYPSGYESPHDYRPRGDVGRGLRDLFKSPE